MREHELTTEGRWGSSDQKGIKRAEKLRVMNDLKENNSALRLHKTGKFETDLVVIEEAPLSEIRSLLKETKSERVDNNASAPA